MKILTKARGDEMLRSEERELAQLMCEYLSQIGARQVSASADSDGRQTHYSYEVQTPVGPLAVSFADPGHHLHCQFADVARALAVLNPEKRFGGAVSPFTGKYNVYAFGRYTGQYAFESIFKPHIERALHAAAQKGAV